MPLNESNSGSIADRAEPAYRESSEVLWCHYNDPGNVGDHACCPIDYADLPGVRTDLRNPVGNWKGAAIVFGGGGILHGGTIDQISQLAAEGRRNNPKLGLVAWGLGANDYGSLTFEYPKFLKDFDLVGIRDYGNPFNYVPCPSCLHPAFNNPAPRPTEEFVIYEHYDIPIDGLPAAPRLSNRGDRSKLLEIVGFLAQGEYIITNSYHGAYWGLLLGRKVMVFRPFSNRFYGFARPLAFCDEGDWREKMRHCVTHDEYLEECRSINWRFRLEVQSLLQDCLTDLRPQDLPVHAEPGVRIRHLQSIRDALAAYRQVYGSYPRSSPGWDGLYSKWGRSIPDWIAGLAPEFLDALPRDPRNHANSQEQYLYHSDGRDFKVISHGADDWREVTTQLTEVADPVRRGWAYGFWTPEGVSW